jgi:hypothetical protein
MTTSLQAVNQMLTGIGQAPVVSLDSSNPEIASALIILDAVSTEIQGEGWHFNQETSYPFLADNNGNISIPTNILSLSDNKIDNRQQYQTVIRDGKLYDKVSHSFDFGAGTSIECDVVWKFDFEDLPQCFQDYIIARATRQFAGRFLGSTEMVQFTSQDEVILRANCISYDTNTSGVNIFGYDNGQVAYMPYAPYRAIQR